MNAAGNPWPRWYCPPRFSSAHRLVRIAAISAETTPALLKGDARTPHLVQARWAVMAALKARGWSTTRIGKALGGRDHTTVMHGLKRAAELRAVDKGFANLCREVASA